MCKCVNTNLPASYHVPRSQLILSHKLSGFRRNHITSTELLNIADDILVAVDTGRGNILTLLNFTRAFGYV